MPNERSKSIAVHVLTRCAAVLFLIGTAQAEELIEFQILPQTLESALLEFADQTGAQVAASSASIANLKTSGVSGRLTPLAALQILVEGNGLEVQSEGDHSFSLSRTHSQLSQEDTSEREGTQPQGALSDSDDVKKKASLAGEMNDTGDRVVLEEVETIVVTAQKRSERLQDTPVAITVLRPESLLRSDQVRLQDYYTQVPGLNVILGNRGEPFVTIRGLTTATVTNPIVGITVDDVPYGSSIGIAGGSLAPDFDPNDLARLEILRGPQGTLYGASAMGGLIKYVTADPSVDGFSGRIQATATSVENGDELGQSFRGSINVPLNSTLALRASAFARRHPGYVDDPDLGIEGVNSSDAQGGYLSTLWRPNDVFSLKLGALLQDSTLDGSPLIYKLPELSDLQQRAARNTGLYERSFQLYSAVASAQFGELGLTSVTGYSVDEFEDLVDLSFAFGNLARNNFGVSGAPYRDDYRTTKFSQELRALYSFSGRVEALVGAFFTSEDTDTLQEAFASDYATGEIVGSLGSRDAPFTFEEWALFADLKFHLTDQVTLQVGARQAENEQTYGQRNNGPGFGSAVFTTQSEDDSFTYLVSAQYKPLSTLLLYARLATGYRPGGPVANAALLNLPLTYEPDTTTNTELGIKYSAFNGKLFVDASIFSIDWEDIQVSVRSVSGFSFQSNAGDAKSEGVEFALTAHPLDGTSIRAWAAYTDARLTTSFPSSSTAFGESGDRLAFSSPWSGGLSIDQRFSVGPQRVATIGGSFSYVDERIGAFRPTSVRQIYPSYKQIDLRAGLEFGAWRTDLFVKNVSDTRGLIGGGIGSINPAAFNVVAPRTIGISLVREFQ